MQTFTRFQSSSCLHTQSSTSLPHRSCIARHMLERSNLPCSIQKCASNNLNSSRRLKGHGNRRRTVLVGMPIDDNVSELLVAQLLWLGRPVSSLMTNKVEPIYLYVNSTGMAGKRASLRSSTIMIRQPLQRYGGMQASDIDIYRREIRYTTNLMADYYAWHTKKDIETIKQDFARPRYFTPYEAVEYGLIDMVLEPNDPERLVYKDWDKIGSKIGVLEVDDESDPPVPANIMY